MFFTGQSVKKLNNINSLLKIDKITRLISHESKNPGVNIVVFSQFQDVIDKLNLLLKNADIYHPDIIPTQKIILVNSSKYREGFDLSNYNMIVLVDFFADRNKNLQIKRRVNRMGQNRSIRCFYAKANLIDEVIYEMPKLYSYEKSLDYIKNKLSLNRSKDMQKSS